MSTLGARLPSKLLGVLHWAGRTEQPQLVASALLLLFFGAYQFYANGTRVTAWDWLLVSGFALLVLGVALSITLPGKLVETLARLSNRGVLTATSEDELRKLKMRLETRTSRWAVRGGLIGALAILLAFHGVLSPLAIVETLVAYPAGWHLGRMASYGTLGFLLKKEGLSLEVIPGHPDEVGGLKPLGDFYFFQAVLAGFPALFLAVWLILMQYWPLAHDRYARRWKGPYLGLLPIGIAIEVLAFLVPMCFFHREMEAKRAVQLHEADKLAKDIVRIEAELAKVQDSKQYELLKEQLSFSTTRYNDIEHMPTWPVHTRTLRLFLRNNAVLALPLLSNFVQENSLWQRIVNVLQEIVKSFRQSSPP
jgi:hypothetical protein